MGSGAGGWGVRKSGAREEIAAAPTDERDGWSLACEKQGAEVLELFQGASLRMERIIWPPNWSGKVSAALTSNWKQTMFQRIE